MASGRGPIGGDKEEDGLGWGGLVPSKPTREERLDEHVQRLRAELAECKANLNVEATTRQLLLDERDGLQNAMIELMGQRDELRAELADCKARLDATVAADLKVAEALRAECDELNARNVRLLEELVECKAQRDTWEERAEFAASQYRRAIGKEE